jgi:hypothetical protein
MKLFMNCYRHWPKQSQHKVPLTLPNMHILLGFIYPPSLQGLAYYRITNMTNCSFRLKDLIYQHIRKILKTDQVFKI